MPPPRRTLDKHVIAYPLAVLVSLGIGAAATSSDASPRQPVSTAAPATVTATTTTTTTATATATATARPTVTKATTVTRADDPAVQEVLNAWRVVGPRPDQQKAAMVKLQREWPTLAKALQSATGISPNSISAAKPRRKATPKPAPPPTTTPDVYYANCSEVRAAGAAPLSAGEPGYRAGLDRDGDGVACE